MAASSRELEALERAVLSASLSPSQPSSTSPSPSPSHSPLSPASLLSSAAAASSLPPIQTLADLICRGDFRTVLELHAAAGLLKLELEPATEPESNPLDKSPRCYVAFLLKIHRTDDAEHGTGRQEEELQALLLGVAALYVFVQANLTGPEDLGLSPCPFSVLSEEKSAPFPFRRTEKSAHGDAHPWDEWALRELQIDGCDTLGKILLPQYLLLARLLLLPLSSLSCETTPGASPSLREKETGLPLPLPLLSPSHSLSLYSQPWWAVRVLQMHQRILAERSPTIRTDLVGYMRLTLTRFGSIERVKEGWGGEWEGERERGERRRLAAAAQLEVGLVEEAYGYTEAARLCFDRAARECKFSHRVSGAMGYRTVHQVEPRAQMVLLTSSEEVDLLSDIEEEEEVSKSGDQIKESNSEENLISSTLEANQEEERGRLFSEESDIFLKPNLVEPSANCNGNGNGPSHGTLQRRLSSMEQAVLLAECLAVRKNNPNDELRSWQMAPYIEAVDSQPRLRPMLHASCKLFRVRWEHNRTHTRERSLSTMEQLVEEIRSKKWSSGERMRYAFTVWLPTWNALQKEYGELLVSYGVVGEALTIFEKLELWDSLIDCYRLLGKTAAAADLVRQRLQIYPQNARLLCTLGDLTFDEDCYVKAWEASGRRYARAKRTLARRAGERRAFKEAITHWEAALAINPLHPDGWFAFGFASMKAGEPEKARKAFTRSVQLEPENGEAWNNIAVLNLERKRIRAAFIALQEAVKYKRDSWQLWSNFTQIALDLRNFPQAVRGLKQILELTRQQQPEIESLSRLVAEVEAQRNPATAGQVVSTEEEDKIEPQEEEEEMDDDVFVNLRLLDVKDAAEGPGEESGLASIREEENDKNSLDVVKEEGAGKLPESRGDARQQEWLEREVRQLVAQVAASGVGGSGRAWTLQARLFRAAGEPAMAAEALLRRVRGLQGSAWQHSAEEFAVFAEASVELARAHMETAESGEGEGGSARRALAAARMHLRNVLKQAQQFDGTKEFKDLTACLQKVEALEQAAKEQSL